MFIHQSNIIVGYAILMVTRCAHSVLVMPRVRLHADTGLMQAAEITVQKEYKLAGHQK